MNEELAKELARLVDLRDKVNARIRTIRSQIVDKLDRLDGVEDGRVDTGDIATKFDDWFAANPRKAAAICFAAGGGLVFAWKFIAGVWRSLGL